MMTGDRLKGDILTIKDYGSPPSFRIVLLRKTPGRICGDLRCQENKSFGTAFVVKIGGGELGDGPGLGIRNKGVHPALLRLKCDPSPPYLTGWLGSILPGALREKRKDTGTRK